MITHDVEEAVFLAQRIYVLSARPGTIQQEFKISLPEMRDYYIKKKGYFQDYAIEIMDLLRGKQEQQRVQPFYSMNQKKAI